MNVWIFNFLYFPEDKSAYIPAAFQFLIFAIICVLTFRWIIKLSKKQELKTKELEERILRERQSENQKEQQ
ncbi:hypothetical protein MHH33_05635 [Paenisporosarcina sp. FSL H8-0542]|uniref:hypothetical protein n=1 Tax=unclassified Paenisporosarcina TaxID=2642018 RepID=UPI00034EAE4B|nr:hypothetical protein [Paenisporosarcina sp. HGH0030]EPD50512.1 hypothetical protein HMPREF1210_02481 [Paenisporosarcina sp. HGH0030]